MIVHKEKKALLLRLRDPNRILTLIPKSRLVDVEGQTFVAVRHGVEEVKVLRNLGMDAPSPILSQYHWPGEVTPFMAQYDTAAFMLSHQRAFCLNEMGTGKTLAILWAYDFGRQSGVFKSALIVSTLSTLERTWADEVFTHFRHLTCVVVHGSREQRLKLLETPADLYVINHDGLKVNGISDAIRKRKDINLIVVDEVAQAVRNSGTDRFDAFNDVCNKQGAYRWVWGMTGSPTPNAPTDAWAQIRVINPTNTSKYFSHFREKVMRKVGTYAWRPREDAQSTVFAAMQPAIRFTRDECFDLPPMVYETKDVELSVEQKKAYKTMSAQLVAEINAGTVTAVNEAIKAQKLIQIATGVVYGDSHEELYLDVTERLKIVLETIEESASKTIVFAPFVSAVKRIAEFLRSKGIACGCIYGQVSKGERDRTFTEFQHGSLPVIVAQPGAMSHGLTLTSASTILWYAPITSNEIFEQANARITRSGQKHSQLIVMLSGTTTERKYYTRLKNRQSVQGLLLDMVKNNRKTSSDTVFL